MDSSELFQKLWLCFVSVVSVYRCLGLLYSLLCGASLCPGFLKIWWNKSSIQVFLFERKLEDCKNSFLHWLARVQFYKSSSGAEHKGILSIAFSKSTGVMLTSDKCVLHYLVHKEILRVVSLLGIDHFPDERLILPLHYLAQVFPVMSESTIFPTYWFSAASCSLLAVQMGEEVVQLSINSRRVRA